MYLTLPLKKHPSQIGIYNIPESLGRQGSKEVHRQMRVELGNGPAVAKQTLTKQRLSCLSKTNSFPYKLISKELFTNLALVYIKPADCQTT